MLEILGLEFDLTVVSISPQSALPCKKKLNSWPARTCKLETEVQTHLARLMRNHSDAICYSFQYIPETVWTRKDLFFVEIHFGQV
jgi:hypothetical protein